MEIILVPWYSGKPQRIPIKFYRRTTYVGREFNVTCYNFGGLGQRGAKWRQKRCVFFVTGTMNSHSFSNGTDQHENRAKSGNRCPLLKLNRRILKTFPKGSDFASK